MAAAPSSSGKRRTVIIGEHGSHPPPEQATLGDPAPIGVFSLCRLTRRLFSMRYALMANLLFKTIDCRAREDWYFTR
jgi:hypothetical protein